MKNASAKHRSSVQEKQQRIARQSDQIMKRIEQIKEELSPTSLPKMGSANRSKWQQYLPTDNKMHSFVSVSCKDDYKVDNYRQSLENRLERLFRQEKEMLKERHFGSSFGASQQQTKISQTKGDGKNNLKTSSSIENMERKIRLLEEKYKQQKVQKQQNNKETAEKSKHHTISQGRGRFQSQIQRQKHAENDSYSKEQMFELQIENLRKNMEELRQNNRQLTEKVYKREEKRKHKQRTKQLLLNILHKVEFINMSIRTAKKRSNSDDPNIGKMQKEAGQLIAQFQTLKNQYRHLDEERRSIQKKQEQIEAKLSKWMSPGQAN